MSLETGEDANISRGGRTDKEVWRLRAENVQRCTASQTAVLHLSGTLRLGPSVGAAHAVFMLCPERLRLCRGVAREQAGCFKQGIYVRWEGFEEFLSPDVLPNVRRFSAESTGCRPSLERNNMKCLSDRTP